MSDLGQGGGRSGAAVCARVRVLDAVARGLGVLPTWARTVVIVLMLAVVWATVALTGGTATSLPHLFYLPIIVAVLVYGMPGGVVVAVAAAVLCGPLMPGASQTTVNWLLRGVIFLVVTGAFSAALAAREALHRAHVHRDVARTLDLIGDPATPEDPDLCDRVAGVLERDEFTIVYQPIFALGSGALIALEALTRVSAEPYRPPDQWFRAAHRQGCGVDMELAAIRKALAGAVSVPPHVELNLNVSTLTLAHPDLGMILRGTERRVILELTEHDVIGSYQVVRECLAALRGPGVRIAVDDAGAGASSLRHIVQLEPDVIKLDASLSRGVASSMVQEALGRSLVDFAAGINAMLVVEGVEHRADLMAWARLGAGAVQGYVLARPGPLADHARHWTPAETA